MIFSSGEAIPYQHYGNENNGSLIDHLISIAHSNYYLQLITEYLNKQFVEYLVNTVEDPPCSADDEESVVNAFVTLILSFNQHFQGE